MGEEFFARLLDAPDPGAIDPLYLGLAAAVIIGLGIASVLAWIVLLLDPANRRVTEDYCPRCGVLESSCICFMHRLAPPVRLPLILPYHPRDPLRRSFARDHFDSVGIALRPDADGERPIFPSWFAAISDFFRGGRDASA